MDKTVHWHKPYDECTKTCPAHPDFKEWVNTERKTNNRYEVDAQLLASVNDHDNYWLDRDDSYWLQRLMQEVGEIAGTLAGDHEGPLELELKQVSGICWNWLRKLEKEGRING